MKFFKYLLIVIVFTAAGAIYSLQMPRFKIWLLNELQIISLTKINLEIKAKHIDFTFLPLGAVISNIQLIPHGELNQALAPALVEKISISLNMLSLIAGRFEIGKILIVRPHANLFFKAPKETSENKLKQNTEIPFDQIIHLPLRSVEIIDADIKARIDALELVVQAKDLSLDFEKNAKAAKLEFFVPHIITKKPGLESAIDLSISARGVL